MEHRAGRSMVSMEKKQNLPFCCLPCIAPAHLIGVADRTINVLNQQDIFFLSENPMAKCKLLTIMLRVLWSCPCLSVGRLGTWAAASPQVMAILGKYWQVGA
jgi:hypothetical protein